MAPQTLISWSATGQNKLKEHELVTKGIDIKLNKNGDNFTEWNEAVASHAKTMGMNDLFDYGPSTDTTYPIHSHFPVKKSFFENHGTITLDQIKAHSESTCAATSAESSVLRCKDECWYRFLFNSCSNEMQRCVSQTVKTHQRRGMIAQKVTTSKVTKADAEAVRLAKNELSNTHLKDFDYDVGKAVEKVRELVSTLEANDINSSSHLDDVIAVFKDKSCCEDFRLHLKMFDHII